MDPKVVPGTKGLKYLEPTNPCRYCGGKVVLSKGDDDYYSCLPPVNLDVTKCKKRYPNDTLCRGGGNGPILPELKGP